LCSRPASRRGCTLTPGPPHLLLSRILATSDRLLCDSALLPIGDSQRVTPQAKHLETRPYSP
jgi:hypothetical protein